ncbi:MAG: recombinase family protein [Pseudomonadota bacterium]
MTGLLPQRPPMLIGYARVSTEDQDLALQIAALKAAGCERIYEDKKSGKDMNRPGWKKCRMDLRDGDVLVVWKLDRLGRSVVDLINTVEELRNENIGFVCTTQSIDTRNAMGRFIFNVLASMAEMEREMISERTKAGIEIAKESGFIPGGLPRITPKIWDWATAKIAEYDEQGKRITDGALQEKCKAEIGESVSWNTFKKWRHRLDPAAAAINNPELDQTAKNYPAEWTAKFEQHRRNKKRGKGRK